MSFSVVTSVRPSRLAQLQAPPSRRDRCDDPGRPADSHRDAARFERGEELVRIGDPGKGQHRLPASRGPRQDGTQSPWNTGSPRLCARRSRLPRPDPPDHQQHRVDGQLASAAPARTAEISPVADAAAPSTTAMRGSWQATGSEPVIITITSAPPSAAVRAPPAVARHDVGASGAAIAARRRPYRVLTLARTDLRSARLARERKNGRWPDAQ